MDICHLKKSELEPQYQTYKGRVVLRGDIVQDDSGSYAVFTEQGSSASQVTAAKSHGHYFKTTRMRRTSSRRSIRLRPMNAPTLLKNSKVRRSRYLETSTVALRGDIVKDNSGSYAVFTEQGSSASQMTAAKIMDIISRLPGCDGQAADAVSAYTQVKMEDAHKLLKIPKSECPDIWIRLPRHKWPKSWSGMEDPVVPLERNLYGHPLGGLLWERQFEKVLLKYGWEKFPNWECMFVNRGVCGRYQTGKQNRKHGTDLENSNERR